MANLGDCRAVLCRAGTAVDLTTDCKASRPDEIARIAEVGAFVSNGRINGGLQVSRAFGDFKDKGNGLGGRNVVSSEPELTEELTCVLREWRVALTRQWHYYVIVLGINDKFVMLACDGLWDVLTSQAAVDFVSSRLGEFQQQQSLDQIAQELALHAINASAA
eukprot:18208-Heterococcus_DN1.PRE.2